MSSTAKSSSGADRVAPIAVTPGEPAGIGPDITIRLVQQPLAATLVCYADPDVLEQRARELALPLTLHDVDEASVHEPLPAGHLAVSPVQADARVTPGKLDPGNAAYVLRCLDAATDDTRAGHRRALVTGPVQKSVINDAGIAFTGHTEYLAARTGAPLPVMMLVAGSLRVALATTHLALREVPDALDATRLGRTLEILADALQRYFVASRPRIGVCGLNPHAGEDGHLGDEENRIIAPLIKRMRAEGHDLAGPLPADTVFAPPHREGYDAIVAMYHDQGLTALKALGFGEAVNVTLGLPMIRTSVDHGTALDLAATGRAQAGSLAAALDVALAMAAIQVA